VNTKYVHYKLFALSLGTDCPQTPALKIQFHSIAILWHGTVLSVTT